jgi:hypothetical protein
MAGSVARAEVAGPVRCGDGAQRGQGAGRGQAEQHDGAATRYRARVVLVGVGGGWSVGGGRSAVIEEVMWIASFLLTPACARQIPRSGAGQPWLSGTSVTSRPSGSPRGRPWAAVGQLAVGLGHLSCGSRSHPRRTARDRLVRGGARRPAPPAGAALHHPPARGMAGAAGCRHRCGHRPGRPPHRAQHAQRHPAAGVPSSSCSTPAASTSRSATAPSAWRETTRSPA